MLYKSSEFNYIYEEESFLLIYNSFVKRIFRIDDKERANHIKAILSNPNVHNNSKDLSLLVENNLVIHDEIDERKISDLNFLKDIMDARLDLTILPTEDCNFRCKYCYESFKKGKMNDITLNAIKSYVNKNIRYHNGLSISWFGGEPLEALDVIEKLSEHFIYVCNKRVIPYYSGIVTNGYHLTLDVMEKLYNLKIKQIQVTVDGNKKNHDSLKVLKDGGPTYDIVINNLRQIRDNFKGKRVSIVVRVNVSTDIIDELDDIIEYFHNEFYIDNRFSFFFRPVGDWGGDTVKSISDSVFKTKNYTSVYENISKSPHKLNYLMYYYELTKNIDICYAARQNSYIIGSDGCVYKCSCRFESEANKIGFLSQKGDMKLDDNKVANWTLASFDRLEKCKYCVLYPVCHSSSCIADQVIQGSNNSNCPHMKINLNYYLKLISEDKKHLTYI